MNAPTDLHALKAMWHTFKGLEEGANRDRLAVEAQILTHFPADKLEGTETDEDTGVTVSFKVARKVDTTALQANWDKLGKNAQAAFKWSADVDTKTYKALSDLDPQTFAAVSAYITTKSNKPSISFKEPK